MLETNLDECLDFDAIPTVGDLILVRGGRDPNEHRMGIITKIVKTDLLKRTHNLDTSSFVYYVDSKSLIECSTLSEHVIVIKR